MERPWTYFLLLVVAWLAGLWGLWQIGDAWVTWPAIDSATAREVARGKLWLAGALILSAVTMGGFATLIRLVQDGFALLAARPVAPPVPRPVPKPEARPAPQLANKPEIPREIRIEPKVEAKVEAKPEPRREAPAEPALSAKREPQLENKLEPKLEPAVRLSGDPGAGAREPRLDRPRPGEDPARREPKLLRDS